MQSVYNELKKDKNEIIDCLIIYSDQDAERKDFVENFELTAEKNYVKFYKIGIELPVVVM